MINIQLSVSEAVSLSAIAGADLRDRIVKAIEIAMGVNQSRDVTITKMPLDSRIPCIKAIRLHSGWGLREAKEWTDMLVGRWDGNRGLTKPVDKNTIKLPTPAAAESLLRDLTTLGCEGYLS